MLLTSGRTSIRRPVALVEARRHPRIDLSTANDQSAPSNVEMDEAD